MQNLKKSKQTPKETWQVNITCSPETEKYVKQKLNKPEQTMGFSYIYKKKKVNAQKKQKQIHTQNKMMVVRWEWGWGAG